MQGFRCVCAMECGWWLMCSRCELQMRREVSVARSVAKCREVVAKCREVVAQCDSIVAQCGL